MALGREPYICIQNCIFEWPANRSQDQTKYSWNLGRGSEYEATVPTEECI